MPVKPLTTVPIGGTAAVHLKVTEIDGGVVREPAGEQDRSVVLGSAANVGAAGSDHFCAGEAAFNGPNGGTAAVHLKVTAEINRRAEVDAAETDELRAAQDGGAVQTTTADD